MPPVSPPEILAPAGDWDTLRAGLAAGADAVYFGLDDGFNARARAQNFVSEDLDAIVRACHDAGARAYLTFNTLVFEAELPVVEALLRRAAQAGVDALIVQDPALCLLAQAVCPALELHASTQMTVSSAEGARFAARLGVTRVVLPRELTTEQVRRVRQGTDLELEVFVHGALCVSWSGQCLTSEAWGGRSANRGQCAQSCRLPYELLVDGERRPLGEARYLLSPRDLAAHMSVPELMDIGVHTLKIEGRLKGAAYVVTAVEAMRRWVDAIARGRHTTDEARATLAEDTGEMRRVYSRGFTGGFLGGTDHQTFVDGRFPKHRGAPLGTVEAVRGREVVVGPGEAVAAPPMAPPESELSPRAGMGVSFDSGDPADTNEPGGRIFEVEAQGAGRFVLRFGEPGPELARVRPGQRVWVSGD
ncbi:MAG: U32 family peptidase, partial [Deltaproteobacteria bacterium]|nr:U32 family peptidase [Deltaproteobacteria bacterium]